MPGMLQQVHKFTSGHFVSHPCFKGFCSRTCYIS